MKLKDVMMKIINERRTKMIVECDSLHVNMSKEVDFMFCDVGMADPFVKVIQCP